MRSNREEEAVNQDHTGALERADDAAGTFPALTDGLQRDSFLVLIEAARPILNIGRGALCTLRAHARHTRPRDWTSPDREPVCYKRQGDIAAEIGADERTVRRHERALEAAGLIECRTMGNGNRSQVGERGIVFTPAIRKMDEIRSYLARREADHREAAQLRAERSTHKRLIGDHLREREEGRGLGQELAEIAAVFATWPGATELRSLSLADLREHVVEAASLADRLWKLCDESTEMSGRADKNVRSYIQATTEDISVSCNPSPDHDCLEKAGAAAGALDKADPLANLTPRRIYALASEDLRIRIDLRKGDRFVPTWHDIEMAAHDLRPDLGIGTEGWTQAIHTMGGQMATLALVLADARREHPTDPVRNPGGYLRGMTRAFERGRLNLVGSLEGLSVRRRQEMA